MEWLASTRRIRPVKIRRLYRSSALGLYDEETLQEIGWDLYHRCLVVVAVVRALGFGPVPCPWCGAEVEGKIKLPSGVGGSAHSRRAGWFHCPQCTRRLLWQDCREALRKRPRCFDCHTLLKRDRETKQLTCRCGKEWEARQYRQSVSRRLRLPCPDCGTVVRRPPSSAGGRGAEGHAGGGSKRIAPESSGANPEIRCPRCKGKAVHKGGYVECRDCEWQRPWRSYRKEQKRRDEKLSCPDCGHEFRWLAWKKLVGRHNLGTGNAQPARAFIEAWPRCRTPAEKMLQVDFLVQALHGRGALAGVFIEGTDQSIRQLLDELASQ